MRQNNKTKQMVAKIAAIVHVFPDKRGKIF
jgi:hypothetical protein